MLLRYPGNGNSIPSLRTVATSVPLPPVGPPPAFGASVFASVLTLASVGVVTFVDFAVFPSVGVAALAVVFVAPVLVRGVAAVVRFRVRMGASRIVDGAVVGCVTDVVGFEGPEVTSPIARSPGGAAT